MEASKLDPEDNIKEQRMNAEIDKTKKKLNDMAALVVQDQQDEEREQEEPFNAQVALAEALAGNDASDSEGDGDSDGDAKAAESEEEGSDVDSIRTSQMSLSSAGEDPAATQVSTGPRGRRGAPVPPPADAPEDMDAVRDMVQPVHPCDFVDNECDASPLRFLRAGRIGVLLWRPMLNRRTADRDDQVSILPSCSWERAELTAPTVCPLYTGSTPRDAHSAPILGSSAGHGWPASLGVGCGLTTGHELDSTTCVAGASCAVCACVRAMTLTHVLLYPTVLPATPEEDDEGAALDSDTESSSSDDDAEAAGAPGSANGAATAGLDVGSKPKVGPLNPSLAGAVEAGALWEQNGEELKYIVDRLLKWKQEVRLRCADWQSVSCPQGSC